MLQYSREIFLVKLFLHARIETSTSLNYELVPQFTFAGHVYKNTDYNLCSNIVISTFAPHPCMLVQRLHYCSVLR
jgi:hypothetical protein